MDYSTGLKNAILNAGLKVAFTSPVIELRSGSAPADPENAVQGDLIATITLPTTGYFATAASGSSAAAGSWTGTSQSSGTVGWFRMKNSADTGASSTTLPRIDGTVSATVGDLILSNTTIAAQDTVTVTSFPISIGVSQMTASATGTFT